MLNQIIAKSKTPEKLRNSHSVSSPSISYKKIYDKFNQKLSPEKTKNRNEKKELVYDLSQPILKTTGRVSLNSNNQDKQELKNDVIQEKVEDNYKSNQNYVSSTQK